MSAADAVDSGEEVWEVETLSRAVEAVAPSRAQAV